MSDQGTFDQFVGDVDDNAAANAQTALSALRALTAHFDGTAAQDSPGTLLRALADALGLPICDCSCMLDCETPLSCDSGHLDEASARAQRGQVDDCLHHLERALPEGYGVIAERLAHHFRSRP